MKYLFITTPALIELFRDTRVTLGDLGRSIFLINLPHAEVVAPLKSHVEAVDKPVLAGVAFRTNDQWADFVAALFTAKFESRLIWGAPQTGESLDTLLVAQDIKPLRLPAAMTLSPAVVRNEMAAHGVSLTVV